MNHQMRLTILGFGLVVDAIKYTYGSISLPFRKT
jgi:hypothetical protein